MTKTTFKIDGQEYELIIDYTSVKYLSKLYEGGTFEIIGRAMSGDVDTFPHLIKAGLLHTGKTYSVEKIEEEISKAMAAGEMSLDDVIVISNRLITDNPFYRVTVSKLLRDKPEVEAQLRGLLE